jgi:hypothetical protein
LELADALRCFHLGIITYWQSLGVLVTCKILFGFGRSGWGHHGYYGHHGAWKKYTSPMWKQKIEESLNQ